MKRLIGITAALMLSLGFTGLNAQECDPYYTNSEGSVREMTSYDKKDKITGTTVQTVKEVATNGDMTEWTIGVVSKDEKGKEVSSGDLKMSCENGVFKMDMRNFLDEEMLKSFEGMEVTMDASDLEYPSALSPGMTLSDGQITAKVVNAGMTVMTLVVRVYDRKVEAVEDITTPAGTFSCYKMTSTVETRTMFSMTFKSTDWVAKKVGPVRSEAYDKGGKLISYMVLTSLK
jgi:hypothetical protein